MIMNDKDDNSDDDDDDDDEAAADAACDVALQLCQRRVFDTSSTYVRGEENLQVQQHCIDCFAARSRNDHNNRKTRFAVRH